MSRAIKNNSRNWEQLVTFDKKQKSCVKRIHLVTDHGLYNRKAFYTVKIVFYSSSMNDGEFINYSLYWFAAKQKTSALVPQKYLF